MDNHAQNGAPVFVTPTPVVNPGVYYASPDSAYAQTYAVSQQQQKPPASGKSCYNVWVGKTSAIWLGAVLMVSGAISQAGAAVAFRFYAGLSETGAGVWCGYMFVAAGAVAIAAGLHETKQLIIGTTVTSGVAVLAAITQLSITAIGLANDNYYNCDSWCYPYPYWLYCPCYYEDWRIKAITANGIMVGAALLAFIVGVWLLVVGCIAVCRKPASFQRVSMPVQLIGNASQQNIYEDIRHQQVHSLPVQYVQQQQQQQQQQVVYLNQPPSNTVYPPTSSQVIQIQVPYISTGPQTMTTSTISNQQVFQVPVQLPMNVSQPNFSAEIRNQQMHSVPVQYVLQPQQLMPLNHPPPNNIAPSTSSQVHEQHEAPKDDDGNIQQL